MPNEQNQESSAADQLEVVEPGALESMERASISTQVATAKRYPRSLALVKKAMYEFATLDEETARGCFFTLPSRKAGEKPIQGPSIRMAEIAMATYKNLRSGSRVIADDGKMITAQGVCHDLENNVLVSIEVKRRVTKSNGQRYSDDMVVMTGNAACAIALRNAVFKVVPLALVKPIVESAKRVALGDVKTLVARRGEAIEYFLKLGIKRDDIFRVLEVKGMEDIGLEEVGVLVGYANAIKEKETTIEEIFSPKGDETAGPANLSEALGVKSQGKPANQGVDGPQKPPMGDNATVGVATGQSAPNEDPAIKQKLVNELTGLILDLNWSTAQMIKHARSVKWLVPEAAKTLSELPVVTLHSLVQLANDEKALRSQPEAKK